MKSELANIDRELIEGIHTDKYGTSPLGVAISHHMRHFYAGYSGVPEEGQDWQLCDQVALDNIIELCAALLHFDPNQEIEELKRSTSGKFADKILALQSVDKISNQAPNRSNPRAGEYQMYLESVYASFKKFVAERYGSEKPTEADVALALDKVKECIQELQ